MSTTYWHGSQTALSPGDVLLPASQREAIDTVLNSADLNGYNRDRIYVTTSRELARAWAHRSTHGCLLRVEPHGELEEDPDFPGVAFSTSRAVVLEVEEHPIVMSMMAARKVFAHTGIERYDEKGFIKPSGEFLSDLVAQGLTYAKCRTFGRWANPHRIVFDPKTRDFVYLSDDTDYSVGESLRSMYNHYGVESVEDLPEPYRSRALSGQLRRNTAALVAERPIPWK